MKFIVIVLLFEKRFSLVGRFNNNCKKVETGFNFCD